MPTDGTAHPASLAAAFQAAVRRQPQHTALQWAGGALSYRELDARSAALAAGLQAAGIRPGAHVGLYLPRSADLMLAILACVRLGAVYVPLDTAYPAERLQWMARDAGLALLLAAPGLPPLGALPCPVHAVPALLEAGAGTAFTDAAVTREAPAYIMYTSGSTGTPKGVVIPQRGILRLAVAPEYARFDSTTRILQLAPNAFDAATAEIWGGWLNGGTLVLAPPQLPDLATLGRQLQEDRINTLWLTTSLFNLVVDEAVDILRPVQQLLTGGEALSLRHARALLAALPHIRLINGYGPTENTTYTTCYTVPHDIPAELPYSPLGPVIRGSYVRVLDDRLQPAAAGAIGELCLGGDGLALGYLNRPELDAERFIDDPLAPGHTLYRSGDRGRVRDDGTLEFHGRNDNQVKIRGYRIEPGEIENALLAIDGVKQAVVLPFQLPQGDKALAAFVVCGDARLTAGSLRERLAARLPAWMVPARFLLLAALPLTANGKADRQQLLALLAGAGSVPARAPADALESAVLDTYRQALADARCQPDERFIDLGGQSIQALRIASQLEQRLGRRVPLCWVYDHGSPAALAAHLRTAPAEPLAAACTGQAVGTDTPELSFPQQRVWFLQQRYPDCRAYHFQCALRFRGPLDTAALEAALHSLLTRHSIFSAGYPWGTNGPVMQRHAPVLAPLVAEPVAGEAAAQAVIAQEFLTAFDITHGPLVRWRLLQLAADDHLLVQTEHHLAHDGWSFNIVLHEMQAVYRARREGTLPVLPPARDFGEYVRERRARYEQQQAASDDAWWQQALAGCRPALRLPWDFPPPAKERFTGTTDRLLLDDALMQSHRRFARSLGTTPFVTLLTALLVLLHRKGGQTDFCVGSGVADRADAAGEQVPGMLVNTLLLRQDLSGDPSLRELIARVHRTTLATLDHQSYPFERALACLRAQGTAGGWSSPEVMFSMHNSPSPALDWPGLAVELIEALSTGTAKSPLNLVLLPSHPAADGTQSAALTLLWEYGDQYFRPDTMQRWQAEYRELLAQLPQCADARLSAVAGRTPAADSRPLAVMPFCSADPALPVARTDAERRIADTLSRLWADWLGGPIDPRTHFVDLGGHSLLAVQLIVRVRELFGVDVPLDTFLDNPTIAGLTQAIVAAGAQPLPAAHGLWRPVIPGPPAGAWFVVPGSHAREEHWYVFRGLMDGIGLSQPLYALYPPHARPQPGVEAMAAEAIAALQALQPTGPYRLAGECIGGVLAYEIARQLTAAGERVEKLVLLDSLYPARPPGNTGKRLRDAWKRGRTPRRLRWALKRRWLAWQGQRAGLDDAAIARRIRQATPIIPPPHGGRYLRALAAYRLKPWDGTVDYVLSEQLAARAPERHWQAATRLRVYPARGSHYDYIRANLADNRTLLQRVLGA